MRASIPSADRAVSVRSPRAAAGPARSSPERALRYGWRVRGRLHSLSSGSVAAVVVIAATSLTGCCPAPPPPSGGGGAAPGFAPARGGGGSGGPPGRCAHGPVPGG